MIFVQVRPLPHSLESFIKDFGEKNRHLARKNRRNSTNAQAAWFVSNCRSFSGREDFVEKLKRKHLLRHRTYPGHIYDIHYMYDNDII